MHSLRYQRLSRSRPLLLFHFRETTAAYVRRKLEGLRDGAHINKLSGAHLLQETRVYSSEIT